MKIYRKRSFHKVLILLPVLTMGGFLFHSTQTAGALSGWKAGRIIDDSVMTRKSSMNVSQIQSFLNSKMPNCDTNGQQLSEFGGPDLNGDGKVQRWEWGKSKYNQTKFPCLRDYTQDGKKSAQIIYDAAQQYSINPQVLLVLLQKEQGLVKDTWPLNIQYRSATGYGCPDTAACDSQYYGLKNQIKWAATMFRAILDDSPTWYTPYELGNNYIQYNPSSSCGGSTVNIENRSTQALYNYTPYQPNKGALDAGWGTANCGAYGNRNFFLYFKDWFDSPVGAAVYDYSLISYEAYSDSAYQNKLSNATVSPNGKIYLKVTIKNTSNQTWYDQSRTRIGTQLPKDRDSLFADTSWVTPHRPASMSSASVWPGETTTFKFAIAAPGDLGSYQERFGLVMENSRWFSESFGIPITVASAQPYYSVKHVSTKLYTNESKTKEINPANATFYKGSRLWTTVAFRNTGNQPLPAGTTKLGTTGPRDRDSELQSTDWLSYKRAAALSQGVNPGATATFDSTFDSPEDLKLYEEKFGILIEGQRWINEDLTTYNLNVKPAPITELDNGQMLSNGQSITSGDESFRVSYQHDGNLVIYNSSNKALWASKTAGKGGSRLVMQYDGNLVIYNSSNKALWASGSNK